MAARDTAYTISPSADSTLALEVAKTGLLRGKKHLLFFENFHGSFCYHAEQPEASQAELTVDVASLVCRDVWLSAKKQQTVAEYARSEALVVEGHPEIHFSSTRITAKPLRGFIVEGELKICSIGRMVKVNIVLNQRRHDTLQLDGDASFRLSDFDIKPPDRFFGLAGTEDQALLRILLWAKQAE